MSSRMQRRIRQQMQGKLQKKFETDFSEMFENLKTKYAEQELRYGDMASRLKKYKRAVWILFGIAVASWLLLTGLAFLNIIKLGGLYG